MIPALREMRDAHAVDMRPLSLELKHALIAMDIEHSLLCFDDSKRGSGQSAPHPQGSVRGDHVRQGASSVAGNVAESHRTPIGHRSAELSSMHFQPSPIDRPSPAISAISKPPEREVGGAFEGGGV